MASDHSKLEDKSVSDLFAETLKGDFDDEAPWDAVDALRSCRTLEVCEEVFQKAVEFTKSEEPLKRARGINVLAQIYCTAERNADIHDEERLEIALHHLSDESEMVVEAAAWALAHMRGERAVNALLTMRQNANADVRHAVTLGLLGETSPKAVDALIELMSDVDDDVRDYATWSLGSEPVSGAPIDSPKIREALRDRLGDSFEPARQEAIWGLAIRKDLEGLEMLLDRLEADRWVAGDEESARYLLGLPLDAPVAELCDGLRKLLAEEQQQNSA